MVVEGKLKMIDETKDVGASGFQKRDCVVTTDEQYAQDILIQFVQDKCNLLADYKVGDVVKIDINLRGREWVNPEGAKVYFNTIQGWRITKVQAGNQPTATAPVNTAQTQTNPQQSGGLLPGEEDPDLPF
jgi:hypothetical protein